MAGRRSSPEEDLHPVFIDSSLGTHFAVAVRHTDTVADLKMMVFLEHLSSFPYLGEMRIDAVKVKHGGHFYHLLDSIPLGPLFERKDYWYIYVDASTSAVCFEEINLHDDPSSDKAPAIESEGLSSGGGTEGTESGISDDSTDAGSAGAASGSRKKLKLDETSKHHKQEDLVLHARPGGSGVHGQEQTVNFKSELIIKQTDDNDTSEKKAWKASPVQGQVLIEAERSVQTGLNDGVDLAPLSYHGHPDGDEADGRASKDDVSHVSSATNLDQSLLSSKKRKKPSQKKESGKNKIGNSNGGHGLEQVDGSRSAIPEAKPKEPAAMEIGGKQITDNVALVDEQFDPDDGGDRSRVQKGLSLLLGENTELSCRDATDERSVKGGSTPDSVASDSLENGPSRDKRKNCANKRDSSRKRTAIPTNEHELKHVEISSGTASFAKHNEPDNKKDAIEEITVNMVVVHEQGTVANSDHRGGIQDGPELALEELNGQVNEKGVTVSALSVDDMGKNANAKKRRKSSMRKEQSKKKNTTADQENLQKHVDDLEVNEKSENAIRVDEEALKTDDDDVSRVQNDPVPEENTVEFIGDETTRGATGIASNDPFFIGVMENKSSAKNRKKFSQTKDLSKKKPLDPDEKPVRWQDPVDKHGPKQIEVPENVSSLSGPGEPDNTGKSIEEKLDNIKSVHNQMLGAVANYGGEVQNIDVLSLREENNSQIPGDGAIGGTGKGHVANELLASGVVVDESSKRNTKKSTDKPSKKKTAYPEEKLGQKQDAKEKILLMHVKDSVGANSSAETNEANNKEKNIKEKPADLVVVHEQIFGHNAGDGVLEEDNELLHGDELNDEAKKVNSAPDSLASGGMEDVLSKKKKKKSTTKPSKKKVDHTDEKLALKQDSKEKVMPMRVEDPTSIYEQTFDVDAKDREQEENNDQFHGDEANGEAEKVNLALDLLASCVMEDESSKKRTKKSINKQNKKITLHLEKIALKQDPKAKVAPKHVKDSVGANTLAETKEADNEQKIKGDSANVAHEKNFDVDAGDRVQEENNEQFDRGEAGKVNLALDLLASCVMEDESSKRKIKKATNKKSKKKTLQLEEKLTWKQDPKENVVPKQVKDSFGTNTSADIKEADNRDKSKENSADVVIVHEQTFDADAGDQVLEENNEQFYGDEAAVEVEKVDLAPDVAVSGVVRDIFSPKKKKPTRTKNATTKKPFDLCEDRELGSIESSPGGISLAKPGELMNSKNNFSVVERNESVIPVRTDVVSQETFEREGMTGTAAETQRKGKRKQLAMDRSVEQEGDASAFIEMSKKEMPKIISTSTVSKSDHRLSSASPVRASDGKHEDCGSINFGDYFTSSRPQVAVAVSSDEVVAGLKADVEINLPNIRKSRDSEASASAIEVTKNNKKRHSDLDRYCVAFRYSSNQSLQKRSLLDKSGSIFKDESSGSSDNGRGSGMSDATTRTPSDDTASSDYSNGDSNALKKSHESGNCSQQNGRRSNMKNLLSTSGKDVELTKILQRSSRYKMAKKAASQSQEKDMDN